MKKTYALNPIIFTDSQKAVKMLSSLRPIFASSTELISTIKRSQFKTEELVIVSRPVFSQHLKVIDKLLQNDLNEITIPSIKNGYPHSILLKGAVFNYLLSSYAYIDKGKLFIPQILSYAKKSGFKINEIHAREIKIREISYMDKAVVFMHSNLQKPYAYFGSRHNISMEGSYVIFRKNHFITHTSLTWGESALQLLRKKHLVFFLLIFSFMAILLELTDLKVLAIAFVVTITLSYFIDLMFNAILILSKFTKSKEIQVGKDNIEEYGKTNTWPSYTIFCPLYKEINVVPQFIKAMKEIDYPENKLKVVFLLEEDDIETKEGIEAMMLPENFIINVVPHSLPKTKPKAVNWGLVKCTSEYIVIYDAEDVPEPDQLKKAVVAFSKAKDPTLICLQAKLNFYNPRQNLLTRMFVGEYSLWFDFILPGLQTIGSPIPLGGTSNHFKRELLTTLKGWDPFNVTEDCDLGVRIFTHGFRTDILDSTTWEEANSSIKNWLRQRSRWIKGYMQTFFVHSVKPESFNSIHFISFLLVVGGKVATLFINPALWVMTVGYFILRPIIGKTVDSFFPAPIFYLGMLCLVFGNFLYLYSFIIGLAKREYWDVIKYTLFVPFYWLMMSVSAWIALYQLIFKPYFWEKTKHGLHLKDQVQIKEALQIEENEDINFELFTTHETNQI